MGSFSLCRLVWPCKATAASTIEGFHRNKAKQALFSPTNRCQDETCQPSILLSCGFDYFGHEDAPPLVIIFPSYYPLLPQPSFPKVCQTSLLLVNQEAFTFSPLKTLFFYRKSDKNLICFNTVKNIHDR